MEKIVMDGGQALIKCLEAEGVEYIFGYSGGSVIPVFDALVTTNSKIKFVLVRHEQGAAHMADGYARATGKPAVCLVTSGPGATNIITGLLTAHMDCVPMIALTGQSVSWMLGKDAFQEADIFNITMPVVKHSYLLKTANEIPRTIREAFHIATTGRPGPVLIDIPKDVSAGVFTGDLHAEMDIPGYTITDSIAVEHVKEIAGAISKSKRPLLLAGHGVTISGASEPLRRLAEKMNIPVLTTLLGKGAFPETHELSLGWPGMHGTAYGNKALCACDLLLNIGSRFDDRILGDPNCFCREATVIHVDIDPAEIGKMIQPDYHCVADAKLFIEELTKHAERLETGDWLEQLDTWKKKYPFKFKRAGSLKMQHIIDEFYKLTAGKAIVVTDVGQHQMWAGQFYKTDHPNNFLSSGGAGTMGFGVPAALGAQFGRPDETVITFCGDGGFQMTGFELATAALYKLPVKFVVLNNHYLGMVRQWQELFYDDRKIGVDLEGNPDFVKLAEAYGIKGFNLRRPGDVKRIVKAALDYNDGPCLINCEVEKTDNVFPMVPAGKRLEEMIIEAPRAGKKLERPTGST
ncbi:MAG: biosynthetic-type acetolactate synthase large subunit [Kiritimatiellales bacterium]